MSSIYIFIASKWMTKSLHCFATRLIEEQIVHPERYNHEGKPKPAEFNWVM